MTIKITGGLPLKGEVSPKGSVFSALAILSCSLLIRERVFLENVPRVSKITLFLKNLEQLGVRYNWVAKNSLVLEVSGVSNNLVTDSLLLIPTLLRFGEATVKKGVIVDSDKRFLTTLGVTFVDSKNSNSQVVLFSKPLSFDANLEYLLSRSFSALLLFAGSISTATLNNFLMTEEMEELLVFLKTSGFLADYIQTDSSLKINCSNASSVTNTSFRLSPSVLETAFWATAAVVSGGDILIKDVSRTRLVSFLSKLTSLGCTFEFDGGNLRVWRDPAKAISAIDINVTRDSLLYDFVPMLLVLMLGANGVSRVSGINLEQEPYFKDLNLFNAKITEGEVLGPCQLRGCRIALSDFTSGLALFLAAFGATTKSEILEAEKVSGFFDEFENNLNNLL